MSAPVEGFVERVQIDVTAACVGCGRTINRHVDLEGHSLRTGNSTQKASYWLDEAQRQVAGEISRRTWDRFEKGWRCAHCRAAALDLLATTQDPKAGT